MAWRERKAQTQAASEEDPRVPPDWCPACIAAGLGVLLVIGFLNYYYRSARTERADEYYKTGNALLQQDRDEEAVQQFRDALSAAPGNPQYRLALGLALAKADHPAEASVYLNALLKRDPENALASLGEARIAAAQGKSADAVKLYHRAIDGSWPAGQEQNRMQARFELVSLLERTGKGRKPLPSCWRPWDLRRAMQSSGERSAACCSATARPAKPPTSFGI